MQNSIIGNKIKLVSMQNNSKKLIIKLNRVKVCYFIKNIFNFITI